MLDQIRASAAMAAEELCEKAALKKGAIVVVGCSTSEVCGQKIGTFSSPEVAEAIAEGILGVLPPRGIHLAAQCCEHLNRAIILERCAKGMLEEVNVIPQPKAGGSFATAVWAAFSDPVAVEEVKADAGLDIGGTLIGMHLKKVAVPLRLQVKTIGEAPITAARTRPKFVGGARAVYNESLL